MRNSLSLVHTTIISCYPKKFTLLRTYRQITKFFLAKEMKHQNSRRRSLEPEGKLYENNQESKEVPSSRDREALCGTMNQPSQNCSFQEEKQGHLGRNTLKTLLCWAKILWAFSRPAF